MATIKFFIQSKNNPASIYVRVRDGRSVDAKAKTKYAVNPADWNQSKGQPKNLTEANSKNLMVSLNNLVKKILERYNKVENTEEVNSQWLKEITLPSQEPDEIPQKLVEYYDYYAKDKSNSVKPSTFVKLNVNKQLLIRFQAATRTTYLIKDVNADFKRKFEEYCKSERYAPNTIARAFKFIKTICYHAHSNGIETHYQLNGINLKTEKVDKIFLTNEEIDKIQAAEMDSEFMENARDWLVISCETGQRVSDFMRFTPEMIRYVGNVPLIEFNQVKTGKTMSVPLSKKVLAILEKRNGAFPRKISDQRYNEYIKLVCKAAGINEPIKGAKSVTIDGVTRKQSGIYPKYELICSHVGRRSFSSNNYGRIPTALLINATGHSTESMFLEYIGKTSTDKALQLAEYFNAL